MATIDTSHTLMSVGTWLQIPFSLFQIAIGAWLLWLLYPVLVDPIFWTTFGWWTALLLGFIVVGGVLALFLVVFWLRWRKDILSHKKGYIASGIFSMLISGGIPGLLVLLAAALYPSDEP